MGISLRIRLHKIYFELLSHNPIQFRSSGQMWAVDVTSVKWDVSLSAISALQITLWILAFKEIGKLWDTLALQVHILGQEVVIWPHMDKLMCWFSVNWWGALVKTVVLEGTPALSHHLQTECAWKKCQLNCSPSRAMLLFITKHRCMK